MDGVLLVDKPVAITSAAVVRRIKSRVKPARVGHLGTLDPSATGLLPILIGQATKLAPFLGDGDKRYTGAISLGVETDTLDAEGTVVRTAPVPLLDRPTIEDLTALFTGTIEQTPPVFSAIKRSGVPLYKLARRGLAVDPPASREVVIRRLILEIESPTMIRFDAVCSPGTYLRALARDVGRALNSAAHLARLRRLQSGTFSIDDAQSLDELLDLFKRDAKVPLISMADALQGLPEVRLSGDLARRLQNGDPRALFGAVPGGADLFKVLAQDGRLIAVARATSPHTAAIVRGFST